MKTITLKAHAKINLFLAVHDRRADGYHNLDSVMHSISLHDDVTISIAPTDIAKITLTCSDSSIPRDSKNTAYRAAAAFMQAIDSNYDVHIHIEKHIPSRAGLGGGSADAATVLRGINKLCENPLSIEKLCEVGATIGADVPFCVLGNCAHATGIGEILRPLPAMSPDLHLVIAMGAEGVSTPDAYRALAEIRANSNIPYSDSSFLRTALFNNDSASLLNALYNDFESVVLHPAHDSTIIKQSMIDGGANGALLSGSGAAVFGIFTCPQIAENAQKTLLSHGYFAELARPI